VNASGDARSCPPPAWAMPLALALALGAYGACYVSYAREYEVERRVTERFERARLERIGPSQDDAALSVVALGHSLLGCATPSDADMEALAHEGGLALRWARIGREGGGVFPWAGCVRAVAAARPDWVLIDERLAFLLERRPNTLPRRVRAHLLAWLREGPLGPEERAARGAERFLRRIRFRQGLPEGHRPLVERLYREELAAGAGPLASGRLAAPLATAWQRFPVEALVAACREAGARLALLEVPLHPEGPPRGREVGVAEARALAARQPGVVRLGCPLALSDADFGPDGRHMSARGRERYAAWLVDALAELADRR